MSLTFIDLFAGIGGFRLGMEQASNKCLGYVEIDKFARKSYEAINDTVGEWTRHDITKVSAAELSRFRGRVDVICGGFPCQAFSLGGNRRGYEDTRGTLFFEIARFAKEIQPQYLFLENVTGLLSHGNGETFRIMLLALEEIGYDVEWQVINSRCAGVAHSRDRVFIIGHSRRYSRREIFPIRYSNPPTPVPRTEGFKIINNTKQGYDFATDGDTINIAFPNSNTRRGRVGRGYSQTLDRGCTQAVMDPKTGKWRRITPREAWRLQGFPDWAFDKAAAVNDDTQLYAQAGNSVTVPVIYEIAKRLV
ncbi:DNA cytosine methyltransferase [Bacillus cereus group sp. BfR-BA-01382]|uniref:DNA cytosine methyltransferase n=1 Tax=Bacillus cereus group sp. BfR-BA-01382 TaxID=2920326 RepID=UPI001F582B4F